MVFPESRDGLGNGKSPILVTGAGRAELKQAHVGGAALVVRDRPQEFEAGGHSRRGIRARIELDAGIGRVQDRPEFIGRGDRAIDAVLVLRDETNFVEPLDHQAGREIERPHGTLRTRIELNVTDGLAIDHDAHAGMFRRGRDRGQIVHLKLAIQKDFVPWRIDGQPDFGLFAFHPELVRRCGQPPDGAAFLGLGIEHRQIELLCTRRNRQGDQGRGDKGCLEAGCGFEVIQSFHRFDPHSAGERTDSGKSCSTGAGLRFRPDRSAVMTPRTGTRMPK